MDRMTKLGAAAMSILTIAMLATSCSGDSEATVTKQQAKESFCGRASTLTPQTKAGFLSDSVLFERAGDPDTAQAIAEAAKEFPTDAQYDLALFLDDDITDQQRSALEQSLVGVVGSENVVFESREQAFENFKVVFADQPDFVAGVDPAALPESFRVHSTSEAMAQDVREAGGSFSGVMKVVEQPVQSSDSRAHMRMLEVQKNVCGMVPDPLAP